MKEEYQDEISLREIIEMLLKNVLMIVLITIAVTTITSVYAFGFADDVYESGQPFK